MDKLGIPYKPGMPATMLREILKSAEATQTEMLKIVEDDTIKKMKAAEKASNEEVVETSTSQMGLKSPANTDYDAMEYPDLIKVAKENGVIKTLGTNTPKKVDLLKALKEHG